MKASTTTCLLLLIYSVAVAVAVAAVPPATVTPKPASSSTLDPKQLRALQSLYIPTTHDPCTQPSGHNATVCDRASPFRHLLSLRLTNCSADLSLSTTALSSLSTLTSLSFLNCHVAVVHFPTTLATNLRSFTSVNSLQRLTGVFLSRFRNLTELNISGDTIKASGVAIITSNMNSLSSLTLSNTNLTGLVPKHLNPKLTHVDLSQNKLNGTIPTSITLLEGLKFLNLSSNQLTGEIPSSFGDLISLQNLSLSSNSLSGPIPGSISSISTLVHLDLGSNQFNGTIPRFISEMKGLKYLNLEKNSFHGVMPFNASFIKRLAVFKIDGNDNLCYNHSTISKKVKLGIAACDKHGKPILPPPAADEPSPAADDMSSGDYDDGGDGGKRKNQENGDHGPRSADGSEVDNLKVIESESEYLFNDIDPYLDIDLKTPDQKPQQIHRRFNSQTDGVVPVRHKNDNHQYQIPNPHTESDVVDGLPAYDIDYPGSKPFMYNFTSQSISQSVSSSSLEIDVVPDHGGATADVSNNNHNHPNQQQQQSLGEVYPSPLSGFDREARVLRYREKRKNRKFEKTIRYASRKAYAETRPRIKGRFAKRSEIDVEVDDGFITPESSYGVVPSY